MNKLKKISIYSISVCVFLLYTVCNAQSPSGTTGSWLMFFNQSRIHDNWSIHTEVQYRSYELTPNTEQLLLRGGVNYHINKTAFASIGYAYISNYAFDKEQSPGIQVSENRTWQQFQMRNSIDRVTFEHRYRLEQRWLQSANTSRYLNRIRYLLRMNVPLNTEEIEKGTLFLSFYDELFIHVSETPFDRNRLYGALGYQFLPNANIQLGYMAQTVGSITKEYLQLAMFYNLDFR